MAIRTPLKLDSTNLKEMSSTDTGNIIGRMVYLYMTDPSVALSVVGSSGSLTGINDTRMQAGAMSSTSTSFPSEASTAEPSVVTVAYDKINEATTSLSAPADTNNIRFPVYYDSGNVKAMSLTDMYDSFVSLASNGASELIPAAQPYKIHTSTTPPSGYTLVSSTAVFTDTRANVGAYSAGGIGETLDQPTTISNYYLHRSNGSAVTAPTPLYIDSNQNLKEYTAAELDALLKEVIRYTSVNLTSNKLRYFIDGAGTTLGTGMANTKLNGSGNYQQRFVNADDYRTQEFPNGSVVTANTYYLKARKV
jgi:predicted ATP-dependent Lon-type protease